MDKTKTKVDWDEVKQEKKKRKLDKFLKQQIKKEEKSKSVEKTDAKVEVKTCSIAVAGSILDNAQSHELRAYLAGQIARTACIYKVTEVIVFEDTTRAYSVIHNEHSKSCTQFARILQYLECPQYLRKFFFPLHKDLEYAGLINPLDAPHHLRQDEDCGYREGITTDKPVKRENSGTFVNVGLLQEVLVGTKLNPNMRVTVKLDSQPGKKRKGTLVSPTEPFNAANIYWGYTVRIASSLSEVFSKCPYLEGYDLTIGTSDKGHSVDTLKRNSVKNYKHCLIVFGGVHGLETALEADNSLTEEDPSVLFDYYLNTCPEQGSRTIRTEEAILITMAELRKKLFK